MVYIINLFIFATYLTIKLLIMNDETKKTYQKGSLLYVGCMFIGLGVGLYFNAVAPGVLIGMGVGFLVWGILQLKSDKTNQEI